MLRAGQGAKGAFGHAPGSTIHHRHLVVKRRHHGKAAPAERHRVTRPARA
jgi:hypothetical protein